MGGGRLAVWGVIGWGGAIRERRSPPRAVDPVRRRGARIRDRDRGTAKAKGLWSKAVRGDGSRTRSGDADRAPAAGSSI